MDNKLLSFMIIIALCRCSAICADFRAIYDFEYTKDSINSIKGKDILYLEMSDRYSLCFSYYTYQTDSLHKEPNGREVWRKLFSAAIAKDGVNATFFPHKRSKFIISKNYYSDTIFVKDYIDNDVYKYNSYRKEFDWQICDSTKTVLGYQSYMATCNYHGREWVVWFTPDIPISDGPWAFCGLPGLILNAQDKDGLFSFSIIGLAANQDPKTDWIGEGKETDRITFLKKKYQFLRKSREILNAELGTNVRYSKDTRYFDGLEPDFLRH